MALETQGDRRTARVEKKIKGGQKERGTKQLKIKSEGYIQGIQQDEVVWVGHVNTVCLLVQHDQKGW